MPHEPKKRHSTQRQGKRRASIMLTRATVSLCPNCGSPTEPHRMCQACGYYKGKQVFSTRARTAQ